MLLLSLLENTCLGLSTVDRVASGLPFSVAIVELAKAHILILLSLLSRLVTTLLKEGQRSTIRFIVDVRFSSGG